MRRKDTDNIRLVLFFICSSQWEGITQLFVWNTWGNGNLLPALSCLRHWSYLASQGCAAGVKFCACILPEAEAEFSEGTLDAPLHKLGQESSQSPQWSSPPGSPEMVREGPARVTLCFFQLFLFSDHMSALPAEEHAREPGCNHLSHISNISAAYPASG